MGKATIAASTVSCMLLLALSPTEGAAARVEPVAAAAQQPRPEGTSGKISLRANPETVCFTGRQPQYLNFDLLVKNDLDEDVKVKEVIAVVLKGGEAVEKRLVWAQASETLGPNRTISAGTEGIIFNPVIFNSLRLDSRVRFDVHFESDASPSTSLLLEPLSTTVALTSCTGRIRLVSPVTGRVHVLDGYDLLSHHRRTDYSHPSYAPFGILDNTQRFGLDLVVVNPAGEMFAGSGTANEDWFGWGQPVRAPADGLVYRVHDGQPDNTVIGEENLWQDRSIRRNEMTGFGNYVLIYHAPDEFSLIAHVQNGSVNVREGDRVRAGQVVARVGNSGASLMPHVHFERRNQVGLRGIRTLPAYFHNVVLLGDEREARRHPVAVDSGDIFIAR